MGPASTPAMIVLAIAVAAAPSDLSRIDTNAKHRLG